MSVSSEREIAHARDVTITECQERLREMGRGVAEGLVVGESEMVRAIAVKFGQHLHDAADALDTLRIPEQVSSEFRTRLKQAGELNYRILTTAGDPAHADRWASLVTDLWNMLRFYDLPGREGG